MTCRRVAVAGQQAGGDLVRVAGEVYKEAPALCRDGGEVCRPLEAEPGIAAFQRAVHQLADEAAIQYQRPGPGENRAVFRQQIWPFRSKGGMHDGIGVARGESAGQSGLPGSVTALQDDQFMALRPVGVAKCRHSPATSAVSSPMLPKRPLTACWIMRFRQFGSRPSANVHQPRGSRRHISQVGRRARNHPATGGAGSRSVGRAADAQPASPGQERRLGDLNPGWA